MADKKISDLTSTATISDADLLEIETAAGNSRRALASVVKTYAAGWAIAGTWTFSVNVAQVDFTNLSGYNELLVIARGISASASGVRQLLASVDNGSTFYTSSGDYVGVPTSGAESNNTAWAFHNTATTSARTLVAHILNLRGTVKAATGDDTNNQFFLFVASSSDVNAIRVNNSGGGNLTAGSILVLGR